MIWDAATGHEIRALEGHSSSVESVAFSADSKYVASGSYNETVKIWDAATGACLQTLHTGRVLSDISFDPTSLLLHTEIGVLALALTINPNPKPNSNPPSTLLSSHTAPNLSTTTSSCEPQTRGLGLSPDGTWITWNAKNLLWLPPEYRSIHSAVAASTVVIGCASGRVFIIRFDGELLSKF
ncbi:quinon protein alcohol dehydrogenase-like superfamily [Neurospora tetraspora]|uniref:Mitochondrial division protein 1 n=1 Tax=Neurospora tetraspora TaxID=94610 RepID=A0AAE0JCI8_9PEZI|nr:quinon protein alcohol dehydrogenase-like superfamily [Neurospora tetraspora]